MAHTFITIWMTPAIRSMRWRRAIAQSSLNRLQAKPVGKFSRGNGNISPDWNIHAYQSWREQRDVWAQEQKLHAKTRDLFSDLYHVITALHRESETLEFIVADGFIRDSQNPDVHHPVLTRCVSSGHGCRLRQKKGCHRMRWRTLAQRRGENPRRYGATNHFGAARLAIYPYSRQ